MIHFSRWCRAANKKRIDLFTGFGYKAEKQAAVLNKKYLLEVSAKKEIGETLTKILEINDLKELAKKHQNVLRLYYTGSYSEPFMLEMKMTLKIQLKQRGKNIKTEIYTIF